jgi:uncharacterized membrane protein
MYPIDRREIKAQARERMRIARPSPLAVGAAYFIITWLIGLVAARLQGTTFSFDWELFEVTGDFVNAMTLYPERITGVYQLLVMAIEVVSLVIGVGMTLYALRVMRGEKAGVGDLFDGFGLFFKIVWLNLVMSVYVFLWSLLLIVPGIIAAIRYSMAPYYLAENQDISAGEALRRSKASMEGHKMGFFSLVVSFVGWSMLALLLEMYLGEVNYVLGIVASLAVQVWVAAYQNGAVAVFYRSISEENGVNRAFEDMMGIFAEMGMDAETLERMRAEQNRQQNGEASQPDAEKDLQEEDEQKLE